MKNKILSLVLAVLCVISMIPFTALAANPVLTAVEILDAEMAILEKPWAADGNYTVNGLDLRKTLLSTAKQFRLSFVILKLQT